MTEAELLEKTALKAGMKSMLNHGAGSCVWSEGCNGVTQEQLLAFMREVALHCAAAFAAPIAQAAPEGAGLRESADRVVRGIEKQLGLIAARAPGNYLDKGPVVSALSSHAARLRAALSVAPSQDREDALRDVIAERERQKTVEGWTPEHDDEHSDRSMAVAAAYYALDGILSKGQVCWPWDAKWRKPKGPRRNLVRAGALILAEIERLDRAARQAPKEQTP